MSSMYVERGRAPKRYGTLIYFTGPGLFTETFFLLDWASRIDPATLENSINIAQNENTDADVTPNNLFQGDIRVATASEGEFGEDSGITAGRPSGRLDPEKLWPGNGSDIPYNISASFSKTKIETN